MKFLQPIFFNKKSRIEAKCGGNMGLTLFVETNFPLNNVLGPKKKSGGFSMSWFTTPSCRVDESSGSTKWSWQEWAKVQKTHGEESLIQTLQAERDEGDV